MYWFITTVMASGTNGLGCFLSAQMRLTVDSKVLLIAWNPIDVPFNPPAKAVQLLR